MAKRTFPKRPNEFELNQVDLEETEEIEESLLENPDYLDSSDDYSDPWDNESRYYISHW